MKRARKRRMSLSKDEEELILSALDDKRVKYARVRTDSRASTDSRAAAAAAAGLTSALIERFEYRISP